MMVIVHGGDGDDDADDDGDDDDTDVADDGYLEDYFFHC